SEDIVPVYQIKGISKLVKLCLPKVQCFCDSLTSPPSERQFNALLMSVASLLANVCFPETYLTVTADRGRGCGTKDSCPGEGARDAGSSVSVIILYPQCQCHYPVPPVSVSLSCTPSVSVIILYPQCQCHYPVPQCQCHYPVPPVSVSLSCTPSVSVIILYPSVSVIILYPQLLLFTTLLTADLFHKAQ
ncbi:unnamed protein product, partial [Ranitomeya imitator]